MRFSRNKEVSVAFNWEIIGRGGVQFFGIISASISHDIKNVLAVLNENAGLLEDLVLAAEKGAPFNQERVKSLAGSMRKQIQRADLITKNMNRFAHSVDKPLSNIDLCETLELIVALSGRLADMRGVNLEPVYTTERIYITTNPFFLENLLWRCLDFAMTSVMEEKTVGIIVEEIEKSAQIKFTKLEGLIEAGKNIFPTEQENALIRALEAEIETDPRAGIITLKLPEKTGL
jgi:C4-dicarboxylate-specific signal transduction histidine kinase